MRKKIAQRAGKALLQSGFYGLLVGALSIPASGWAAGFTQEFGKVLGTQAHSAGLYLYLDPASANNVNNCTYYSSPLAAEWLGQQAVGIFSMIYPTSGAPSEAQKVMISQISLAMATGKPIKIYSASCNATIYNNIDQIILKAN